MAKYKDQDPKEVNPEKPNDLSFIEEFIEQKKSQNRILQDMIEKLNTNTKPDKGKKKNSNPSL